MALEDFDLDKLEDEVAEETGESKRNSAARSKAKAAEKASRSSSKKSKPDSFDAKFKSAMLKHVLPLSLTAVVMFMAGSVMSMSSGPSKVYQTVDNVKDEVSVLEKLESVKDSQILALQSQLDALSSSNSGDPLNAAVPVIAGYVENTSKAISAMMSIAPGAEQQSVDAAYNDASAVLAMDSAAWSESAKSSAAVELGEKVAAASSAQLSLMSASDSGVTCLAAVPSASEEKQLTVYYVVSLDRSGKVTSLKYAGLSESESTPF